MQVPASGGEPQPLTNPESSAGRHAWPEFLPDGKAVLFTITNGYYAWQLAVLSLETNTFRVLLDGTDGRYMSSGYLVFGREGSLWSAPFDSKRLELEGKAAQVVEGVQVYNGGWAQYALAEDGTLAYMPGGLSQLTRLTWVDRQGKEQSISAKPGGYFTPRVSPDGERLALTVFEANGERPDIWIWDFTRETLTRLTRDEADDRCPLWTPDGKGIVFYSDRDNSPGVYCKAADGTGKVERLSLNQGGNIIPCALSADGNTLVFVEGGETQKSDIGTMSMEGDHAIKLLLHGEYDESSPQISPDGRWMAYASDETGKQEVYVRPFPEVDKWKVQISTNGGDYPIWSRNGELFYQSNNAMMAVAVGPDGPFNPGKPELLFRYSPTVSRRGWDISPDGKRFLMIEADEPAGAESAEGAPVQINIVLNWVEGLKQEFR